MALVRKRSRLIVVDGTAYRWRLRGRPTYFQGLAWSPCTFAVEHADTPGTTLVVTTDQPHPSNWIGRDADGSGGRVPPRPVRWLQAVALNSRGIVGVFPRSTRVGHGWRVRRVTQNNCAARGRG